MSSALLVIGILVVFSFIVAVRAKRREHLASFHVDPETARLADQAYLLRRKTDEEYAQDKARRIQGGKS